MVAAERVEANKMQGPLNAFHTPLAGFIQVVHNLPCSSGSSQCRTSGLHSSAMASNEARGNCMIVQPHSPMENPKSVSQTVQLSTCKNPSHIQRAYQRRAWPKLLIRVASFRFNQFALDGTGRPVLILVKPPREVHHDQTDARDVADVDASFVPVRSGAQCVSSGGNRPV